MPPLQLMKHFGVIFRSNYEKARHRGYPQRGGIRSHRVLRAMQVSGERTKKAAVTKALQEFIARRRRRRLLDLMGKLDWEASDDYKVGRARD
jgi:hypothetical protein